jgi:hypothetical protein
MITKPVPWSDASSSDSEAESGRKKHGGSAVSNGMPCCTGLDGRNPWSRRYRDVMRTLIADLGGDANSVDTGLPQRAAGSTAA